MEQDHDWVEEYKTFVNSHFGKEVLRSLTERRSNILASAEQARTNSEQLSLLNQAYGVRLAIEHIKQRSITVRTGGKKPATNK